MTGNRKFPGFPGFPWFFYEKRSFCRKNPQDFSAQRPNYEEREPSQSTTPLKRPEQQNTFERFFEATLWNSRLIVLLAVAFGMFSSIILFISGSLEVINTLRSSVQPPSRPQFFGIKKLSFYKIGDDPADLF